MPGRDRYLDGLLAASIVETGGRIVVLGVGRGTLPWQFSGLPLEAKLTTSCWGNLTELREVVSLAEQGRIHVRTQRFTLDQTLQAYHLLEKGTRGYYAKRITTHRQLEPEL